ncbi:MAG TPA: hypothetical protein VEJ84_02095, partial [Acidimicrobiales bacterium]|nr:hypothetical protein [Acidimicrobiales bacterium]
AVRLPSALFAVAVAAAATAVTLNADSYDAARWTAGQEAVRAGYAAGTVDAGFEWVGSHTAAVAQPGRRARGAPSYEKWYVEMFPGSHECAVVAASALPVSSLRLLGTARYEELGFAVPEHLYIYGVVAASCPPLR